MFPTSQISGSGRPIASEKQFRASTRLNSMEKWQCKIHGGEGVIGALEVHSEPTFNPREKMNVLEATYGLGNCESFEKALEAWNDLSLKKGFIDCAGHSEIESHCFGIIANEDKHLKDLGPHLNKHWVPIVNKQLKSHGVKVDVFLWSWHNLSGKGKKNVLLIRFFSLELIEAASKSKC